MKKKIRKWMILSYFFVLSVFLLSYLGIQRRTENKIREIYTQRQLSLMKQSIMAVDEQLTAVNKFCLSVLQEPYVQYFTYVDEDLSPYDLENVTKLVRDIRSHYIDNPFVEDFFLFYEKSGRIAHANGFYPEADFTRLEWHFTDAKMQAALSSMLREKECGYLPVSTMTNDARSREIITYVYNFGGNSTSAAAKLVLLLNKDWLDETIREISSGGKLSIRDGRNDLALYTCLDSEVLTDYRADPEAVTADNDSVLISWQNDQYLLTKMTSAAASWQYELLTPYDTVKKQARETTGPLILGLICYLIFGVPLCLLLSGWNYAPIRRLTRHVEAITPANPDHPGAYANEVEYISSGIESLQKRYHDLEEIYGQTVEQYDIASRKLQNNRDRIRESTLFQLINGYWQEDQIVAERLRALGLTFDYPRFCVITIRLETNPGEESLDAGTRSLRLFILKNVSAEYLQEYAAVYPVARNSEQLYLLVNLRENAFEEDKLSSDFGSALYQMMFYFHKELQLDVSIAAGGICDRLDQLCESRRQSLAVLDYRMILGKNSLLLYDQMTSLDGSSYHFDEKTGRQLLGAVAQKDALLCAQILDQLYEDALKQFLSVKEGSRMIILLTDIAMEAISRENLDQTLHEEYQDMISGMLKSETLPEFLPVLKAIFTGLCENRKDHDIDRELEEKIMGYLSAHCWESDFSLNSCAEYFQVSPAHLSRTIHSLTGRKFIDIVNQLRLDRAKGYLLETDKKMEEIAELAGYGTVKSFFRNFKQAEGMPPGVWRKEMKGN